jgi:pterin-4a-carbinolamine dehydratase
LIDDNPISQTNVISFKIIVIPLASSTINSLDLLSAKIEKKTNEGEFRSNDVEEFKPSKEQLSDLKSKYLPDWEMLDHRILQAEYTAKDHRHADQFTKVINKISEEMDHFCEVTQDVAEVTVKTTTSDVKGLTLLDFEIAMRIDKVAEKMDIEQIRSKGNFDENFADGKGPGRPGDSGRHGIPKGATIAQLEKASKAKGRKGQLARWQLNMRRGKKKG